MYLCLQLIKAEHFIPCLIEICQVSFVTKALVTMLFCTGLSHFKDRCVQTLTGTQFTVLRALRGCKKQTFYAYNSMKIIDFTWEMQPTLLCI